MQARSAFLTGGTATVRERLESAVGVAVTQGVPERPRAGDVVFLDAATPAGADLLPWGNAFAACRALKRERGVIVFMLVRDDDEYSPEIARFCLADGCLRLAPDGSLTDLAVVCRSLAAGSTRPSLDDLLDTLERGMRGQGERQASAVEKILDAERGATILDQLTDAETGLFDGPFASFKLDEEFKRAQRFHQPLSLILLDSGVAAWPPDSGGRRALLAELASIFLNECRDIDVLARFSEKIFLFLLPGTGPDGAKAVALRMIEEIRRRPSLGACRLDPAAGVATVPATGVSDRREFLALAEACLRRARAGATDRVSVEPA